MNILGYDFEGPWFLGTKFNEVPGIYVVFAGNAYLDVGETDKLGSRINEDNHERKPDWVKNANGYPVQLVFLRVVESSKRLVIESYLRKMLQPTCGER